MLVSIKKHLVCRTAFNCIDDYEGNSDSITCKNT